METVDGVLCARAGRPAAAGKTAMLVNGPLSTRSKSFTRLSYCGTAGARARGGYAKEEAAVSGGFKTFKQLLLLRLQLVRNVLKLGVQGRADRVHRRDDDHSDATHDQAVFNRRGAGLVLQKCKDLGHSTTPCGR